MSLPVVVYRRRSTSRRPRSPRQRQRWSAGFEPEWLRKRPIIVTSERAQVASPSPTPCTPRAHSARQHHYRSIIERNAGTCERRYIATAPTAPQPQWQSATHAIRKMSSAGRGRRRKAPRISPSSAPPLSAALHAHHAALGRAQRRRSATGATIWPRQGPPPPQGAAAGRATARCGGSSRANPTLAFHPPARMSRPDSTHSYLPSRWTGRS